MAKMKALRSFTGRAGEGDHNNFVDAGTEFRVEHDHRMRDLERGGLAYVLPEIEVKPLAEIPSQVSANEAAKSGPFVSPGGGIGAETAPSLSHPGRRPQRRGSKKSGASLDL